MLIRTPRLLLTTPRPEDYRPVFEVSLEPEVFWRWNPSDQSGSYDRFVARLWDGILCQFVVRRRNHNAKTIGLVRLHDANFVHQTVQISGYMAGEALGTGLGAEAFIFATNWVFESYPFRKVYAESIAYNYAQFSSGSDKLFRVEGVLREHEIHRGVLYDHYILSADRQTWIEELVPRVERMRLRHRL